MPARPGSDAELDSDVEIVSKASCTDERSGSQLSPNGLASPWGPRAATSSASPPVHKKLANSSGRDDTPHRFDPDDDLFHLKPLVCAASTSKNKGKQRARTPDVIELSSGSDAEADAALVDAQREQAHTRAALTLAGWKFGRAPEGEGGKGSGDKKRKMDGGGAAKKVAGVGKGNGKGTEKKRARMPSDDEHDELADDEGEVDKLASDNDADADDEVPLHKYTKDEVLDKEDYWLYPPKDTVRSNLYKQAARLQLFRDYDYVTESHIRKILDEHKGMYAPTYLTLHHLGIGLVKLRGRPRDMNQIRGWDGKLRPREKAPPSSVLEKERAWLAKYAEIGGYERYAAAKQRDRAPPKIQAPTLRKKSEMQDERHARTQPAASMGTKSGSKADPAAKKSVKRVRMESPVMDEEDGAQELADGWGPDGARFNKPQKKCGRGESACEGEYGGGVSGVKEEDGDAFPGRGFKLGD